MAESTAQIEPLTDQRLEVNSNAVGKTKVGGRAVLSPKGSLTFETCEEFEVKFNEYLDQKKTEIILELKSVPILDSEALELLLRMQDELKARGGLLKIAGLNDICRDILVATRLINVFHVYEDLHAAMISR
jgi:anti-anti-sigma factor